MLQADLFSQMSPTPRARHSDPETSHIAATRVSANAHRNAIAEAIRLRHGMTYRQIADWTGLEPVAVGRRLVELERLGLAKPGEATTVDGRTMRTWWPA